MSKTPPEPEKPRFITPSLSPSVMVKLVSFIWVKQQEGTQALSADLRRLVENWQGQGWSVELRAVSLVLADLVDQGWEVSVSDEGDDCIRLQPPGLHVDGESQNMTKDRIRRALVIGRDRQLQDAGVKKFLGRMHRTVRRLGVRTSIQDVVDDGTRLSAELRSVRHASGEDLAAALKGVVDPVVEVCDPDAKCSVTGLYLGDIWRYFRHSWSLEYRSLPGRQLAFLIRNAARPNKPVMGIAMMASPVVRMRSRDNWIGWNTDAFVELLATGKIDPAVGLRSLLTRIERNISEIRSDDLATADELAFPTERTVLRLEQRGAGAALARRRKLSEVFEEAAEANQSVRSQRDIHKGNLHQIDWRAASEDDLFVMKRAETLASLLQAKRAFQSLDWSAAGVDLLHQLLRFPEGSRALDIALLEVRKGGLSSQVADICVCGAVAPYSHLLTGKLVALLMASNEVLAAYRARYATQVSLISSQMAGRPIYRPAELKVLTTTSLYGSGSSQYNRLKLRKTDCPELDADVVWQEVAKTAGFGTVHLSPQTVRTLREFTEGIRRSRQVNHRFGEGASPRLRQIRQALDDLGIESSDILNHATPRLLYSCEIHPGAREELLGMRPLTESQAASAGLIAELWRRRWLANRIQNDVVLTNVAAHSVTAFQEMFEKVSGANQCSTSDSLQLELPLGVDG